MFIFICLILIITGIISGFLTGLFGLGGGLTIIPAMIFILPYFKVAKTLTMHIALGTSLAIMFFNNMFAVFHHNKNFNIDWNIFKKFAPFILLGVILGSINAHYLPNNVLLIFFLVFLAYVIAMKLINMYSSIRKIEPEAINTITVIPYGIATGLIATTVGGGSSLMIVLFLTKRLFTVQNAVKISSFFNIFIAFIGAISNILLGLHDELLPKYSLGYVYLPAVLFIFIGGLLGVPIGVEVLKHLSDKTAKWLYLWMIVFIFILMLVKFINTIHT